MKSIFEIELTDYVNILRFDKNAASYFDFDFCEGPISENSLSELVESIIRNKSETILIINVKNINTLSMNAIYRIISIKSATEVETRNFGYVDLRLNMYIGNSKLHLEW